jgi:hypothetical protein
MTAKLKRAQKTIFTRIRTLYSFLRLTPTYQVRPRIPFLCAITCMSGLSSFTNNLKKHMRPNLGF